MNGDLFGAGNYSAPRFPPPWPHQERAHTQLREGFRGGHRRQLLVAPTGSGKTVMGLRVIHESLAKGKRALFVCDRTALINQTSARADEYGLDHAIVQADHWRRDNSMPFQIASIQTIAARGYWPAADVIVIDEAHTQHSAWVGYIGQTEAAVIGLTATPCTRGLALSFTHMVNAATMHELTEAKVLASLRILTCVTPDMAGAKTSGGEWTAKAASERELTIIGDVVSEWQQHAAGRKTIAFGADIAYCIELVRRFNQAGVGAATYTCETPDAERLALLEEFRKSDPSIRVLVSVEALAKGFDVPDISCVIDARPLRKSLSAAIQMWGRGLRSSPDTSKDECLLLDHSGNFRRFHDDFVDVYFNGFSKLDEAEKLDRTVRAEQEDFVSSGCPKCGFQPFRRRCLSCGHEKESRSLVDSSSGVMQEIRIGKRVLAQNKRDLWNQICTFAKTRLRSEKKAGWAWFKFQDITGEKPPRAWSFDEAPLVEPTSATIGKLKSLHIAFRRGRESGGSNAAV